MSGSLMQYICCDWDIIELIKLAIISHGKSMMQFKMPYEISCILWKCVIEDSLINFFGHFD